MTEHTLPQHVGIDGAEALKAAVLAADPAAGPVKIVGEDVTTLSCAAAQTMVAAAAHVKTGGGRFIVARPSDGLVAAFEDLGLYAALMEMEFEQ